MIFDNFHIGSSEYDFYKSLPADEKLLFIYDLICTNYYTEDAHNDIESFTDTEYSDNINSNSYRTIISDVLDRAVDLDSRVNIIFINDLVVFNSLSKRYMSYAILDMSFDGVILDKIEIPENLESVFKKQTYCEVYKVLDITNPILPKHV